MRTAIEKLKSSRFWSFVVITLIYVIAAVIGVWIFTCLNGSHFLVRLFAADFAATVFVWLWGVVFGNSSVYDPYWSVAPPLMLTGYALYVGADSLPVVLLQVAVWYWAIRLTGNWAYTFPDLNRQDWRYELFNLYPTPRLIVSAGSIGERSALLAYGACHVTRTISERS